ncbi:transposase [Clostridium sp. JNZ X4-2]
MSDKENVAIIKIMIQIYSEVQGIYEYRRMNLNINRILKKKYNYKRIYRLMKSINMKSVIHSIFNIMYSPL